jgi:hypothetical protein
MDEENNDERVRNESRDRFGRRLPCFECGGDNVEIQVMRFQSSDRNVVGLHRECEYWLEWDCRDCTFYKGMVIG